MIGDDYTCGLCRSTFKKALDDDDVEKEAKEMWGDLPESERAIVCDDCWKLMSCDKILEAKRNELS